MAFIPTTLPEIWDIPTAVGVPALLGQSISDGASASASTVLGTAIDEYLITNAASQWGIFTNDNNPVLTSGRVRSVDIQTMYQISDAPQENGAFMSYNKVKIPGQYAITMLCDGSSFSYGDASVVTDLISTFSGTSSGEAMRKKEFIALLEALCVDLTTYIITTPERNYTNVNVLGYHIRRSTERGVSLLWADIALQEIRQTSKSGVSIPEADGVVSSPSSPSGASKINTGNVQSTGLEDWQVKMFADGAGIS